jgi:hypothetical protein
VHRFKIKDLKIEKNRKKLRFRYCALEKLKAVLESWFAKDYVLLAQDSETRFTVLYKTVMSVWYNRPVHSIPFLHLINPQAIGEPLQCMAG